MSRTFTGNYNQGSWRRTAGSRPFVLRKYSDETDFVVLWGVDEDRFWVVPATVFDNRQGLALFPNKRVPVAHHTQYPPFSHTVFSYEGRWDLLVPSAAQEVSPNLREVGGEG